MDPPWSMSIKDEAPLTLICQTHGRAAIVGESSGTVLAGARRRRADPRHRALRLRRRPRHHADGRHPSGPALHHAVRRGPAVRDVARGAHVGQQRIRRDALGDLRLRGPQRGQRAAARCVAHRAGTARRRMGHAAGESARRRGGPRGSRPGGVSRPAARPAADRRTAHLVRPRRERPDLVARRTRPGGRPGAEADLQQSRAPLDGRESRCSRGEFACRVRQQVHRAGRRTTDRVPDQLAAGAGRRPVAVEPGPPSPPLPGRSATARRSR